MVEGGRQPGRVRVPGQDVEGRRVLTEQVVVHPVVPYQVVGAQPGEHLRHLPAVDHPAAGRCLLGQREGLRCREQEHPPVGMAVEQGDGHRRGVDPMVLQSGEVRLHERGHDPAQATAHDVHVRRTGHLAGSVDRLDRRLRIGIEIPVALRPGRVAPADAEHLDALLEQVFDHAAAGGEIQGIVLVDLRRHHEHGPLVDGAALRRVLDQLENLGPVNDRAGCRRDVFPEPERPAVDHRRHAPVVAHVTGPVGYPAADAAAAGVLDALEGRGIAQEKVGGRQRFPDQGQREARPLGVHALDAEIVDDAIDPRPEVEIRLHDRPVNRVLSPRWVGKALVPLVRRDLRLAEHDPQQLTAGAGRAAQQRLRLAHRLPAGVPQDPGRLAEAEAGERPVPVP